MRKKCTISEQVYMDIKNSILKGKYKGGNELNEITLSEELSVSRTPVREALKRLEKDSLIRITPHKGAMVVEPTLNDVLELSSIREVVEGLAAKMAAKRIRDEEIAVIQAEFPDFNEALTPANYIKAYEAGTKLHDLIVEKAGSKRIGDIINNLKAQIELVTFKNAEIPGRYEAAFKEHQDIINALKMHDDEAAEKAMKTHIKNVMMSLIDYNKFMI